MPGPSRAASAARRHAWALRPPLAAARGGRGSPHRWVFPAYSWNRDEPVYLWHVEVLRSGQLTATDGGHPDLFHPWLSAAPRRRLLHAVHAGLAPRAPRRLGCSPGRPPPALRCGAALAVLGTYALAFELTRDRTVAAVAGAVLVASPLLPVQGGVHLSYLFTLGLGLLFGAALLVRRAHRLARSTGRRRPARGLDLPHPPLRRPALGRSLRWLPPRRRARSVARGGGAPRPRRGQRRPARAAHPRVQPAGHRVLARVPHHGRRPPRHLRVRRPSAHARRSSRSTTASARPCGPRPRTRSCSPGSSPGATWGSWSRGGRCGVAGVSRALLCLVLVMAVFPLGYFVFWGTWLSSLASRISGPIYFVPLYGPLCILIALGLVDLGRSRPRPWPRRWSRSPSSPRPSRSAGCGSTRRSAQSRSPGARAWPGSMAGPW